jgi:hypothetical protein
MSEHLQVVLDIVTGEISFRHTQRERPATRLLKPPSLLEMPTSVLCARPETSVASNYDLASAWRVRRESPGAIDARNAGDGR